MRAFAIAILPAAIMAANPVIHAGGPQSPPTLSGPVFPTNTTGLLTPTSNTGNLSLTKTTSSTSSASQSVVLITTSQPGGGIITQTSFVGANPTATPVTTPGTGITQPGAATKVGNGAAGALALAIGVCAFFL